MGRAEGRSRPPTLARLEGEAQEHTVTCPIQHLAKRTDLSRRLSAAARTPARVTRRAQNTQPISQPLHYFLSNHIFFASGCELRRSAEALRGGRLKTTIGMRNRTDRGIRPFIIIRLIFKTAHAKLNDDESSLLRKAVCF